MTNKLRIFLLGLFLFGLLGTGAELFLLDHTEDVWQWVPLVLMAASLAVLAWYALRKQAASVRAFQGVMGLFIVAGLLGVILHYQGNAEFEMEMYPSLKGLDLLWESLTGATPALAPGTMIQLGLLGLAFTYRHPTLARAPVPESSTYSHNRDEI
jgi:hypothetical protein